MELPLDPQMLLMKSNNNSLPFRAYGDEMANKNGQEEMISEIRRSEYNPLNDFPTVVGYQYMKLYNKCLKYIIKLKLT